MFIQSCVSQRSLDSHLSRKNDGLDTQVIDIGNAYNEGEIIAIITGTKFGDLEGHILSIFKEIYGMRSDELIW